MLVQAAFSGLSQPRRRGDERFRILVTGGPPKFGGGGIPQLNELAAAAVIAHDGSFIIQEDTPGMLGRLPALLRHAK
jgi:hypothetical protein